MPSKDGDGASRGRGAGEKEGEEEVKMPSVRGSRWGTGHCTHTVILFLFSVCPSLMPLCAREQMATIDYHYVTIDYCMCFSSHSYQPASAKCS